MTEETQQVAVDRALGLLHAYFRNDSSSLPLLVTDLLNERLAWRARAETAEQKLNLLRERIHAYAGREELLAILATGETLYPTLMTQVGKDKP